MTTETTTKPAETALAKPVKLEEQIQVWETEKGEVKLSVALVRMYFCPEATTVEAMTFLSIARYQKLNPFLREIYLIKYGRFPASIVVGKDTFTKRAERHPKYRGFSAGIIVSSKAAPEKVERRKGCFYQKATENLVGGWAIVPREKDGELPVEIEVSFDEYVGRTGDGQINRQWAGKPATMIRKVALVQALRERFPEEFEGMYDEAEIRDDSHRPEEFGMPLSVAEAAVKDGGNGHELPAAPEKATVQGEEKADSSPPAGGPDDAEANAPSLEEQEAIRAQEQAEAEAQAAPPPPPVKVDRGKVWNAVLARAKASKASASAVLMGLTARHNMTDLTDTEVVALAKKLGV